MGYARKLTELKASRGAFSGVYFLVHVQVNRLPQPGQGAGTLWPGAGNVEIMG